MTRDLHIQCPKCGHPQYCGCKACRERLPPGIKPWRYVTRDGVIACGNCGFRAHEDWWLDEDVFQLSMYSRYWSHGEYDQWRDELTWNLPSRRVWRPARTI